MKKKEIFNFSHEIKILFRFPQYLQNDTYITYIKVTSTAYSTIAHSNICIVFTCYSIDQSANYRQLGFPWVDLFILLFYFEVIDKMLQGKGAFKHKLNEASRKVLEESIKKALDNSGFIEVIQSLEQTKEQLQSQLKEENLSDEERKKIERELEKVNKQIDAKNTSKKALEDETRQSQVQEAQKESGGAATQRIKQETAKGGGCFPGSADVVDAYGNQKAMDSLQIGDQVQVIVNEMICLEPVIAYIHRQPEVLGEFLNIITMTSKNLKITEDHLLFVERMGQVMAIPARDVKIGDTICVTENDVVATDTVRGISTVFEKGVYAPVTLSGTILVNDVHTSCYFDVLSHEWSHRAMGVARAVYYVSPWMLQWISGVGQKDGFPGWCRLAHKMLTLLD